eukprot:TCONS_00010178-protein
MEFDEASFNQHHNHFCNGSKKRKVGDLTSHYINNNNNNAETLPIRRDFLFLTSDMNLHHLDHLPDLPYSTRKQNSNVVYLPLKNNILINMKAYTEIMFRTDQFFLGDETGRYEKTVQATAIDFLMHCPNERRLYVARSIVTTDKRVGEEIAKKIMNG